MQDITEEKKTTLVMIRGLPGSGKSTMARKLVDEQGYCHFENDMYHINDGVYDFDVNKVVEAGLWCRGKVEEELAKGNNVVVSNTFIEFIHMSFYINLISDNGYKLEILEATGNYGSVYDVPVHVLASMKKRWQELSDMRSTVIHTGF